MNLGEQIFSALTDVGTDLVDMAEHQRFAKSPWRKLLSTAACLLVMAGLGTALWHYLSAMPAQPVMLTPPVEAEPAPETEPGGEETPAESASLRELEPRPYYIFDPDPQSDDHPSKVIDSEGNVILEVESGLIQPLIDQESGEYVGIQVYHLPEGQTLDAAYLDEYNLKGEPVTSHLTAYAHEILGDVEIISSYMDGEFSAALYRRSRQTWLRGDLQSGYVVGDCISANPMGRVDQEYWLFDSQGSQTVIDTPIDNYCVWDGKTYLSVYGDNGRLGLMDSKGNLLTAYDYTAIFSIGNGYIRCQNEEGYYGIDLDTGEVVFQWPNAILNIYQNMALVHDENLNFLLVDWDGSVINAQAADLCQVIDDDNDGTPERFFLSDGDTYTFLNRDGSVQSTFTFHGTAEVVTSNTVALLQTIGEKTQLSLLNLETKTQFTDFRKDYQSVLPLREENQATGLFYACYDGGIDLLREDGTVVLENIRSLNEYQGDVFFCIEDGVQGLKRLDGAWLYREPIE